MDAARAARFFTTKRAAATQLLPARVVTRASLHFDAGHRAFHFQLVKLALPAIGGPPEPQTVLIAHLFADVVEHHLQGHLPGHPERASAGGPESFSSADIPLRPG